MIRISSTEFCSEVDRFQDAAQREPVVFTGEEGRDQAVLIPAAEFERLQRRDGQTAAPPSRLGALEAIQKAAMNPRIGKLYGSPEEETH